MIKRLAALFFVLALGCVPALPAKWLPLFISGGAGPPVATAGCFATMAQANAAIGEPVGLCTNVNMSLGLP